LFELGGGGWKRDASVISEDHRLNEYQIVSCLYVKPWELLASCLYSLLMFEN